MTASTIDSSFVKSEFIDIVCIRVCSVHTKHNKDDNTSHASWPQCLRPVAPIISYTRI